MAEIDCTEALKRDPNHLKALYRRGEARMVTIYLISHFCFLILCNLVLCLKTGKQKKAS